MRDIARETGVSVQTVSRALTGKGYVSADVRERVQDSAQRLGYRPNRAAQRLRGRTSDEVVVIGFLMNELSIARLSPFERTMREAGFRSTFMLDQPDDAALAAAVGDLLRAPPAAVLTDRIRSPEHRKCISRLERADVPCVVVDSRTPEECGVAIDRSSGVAEAMAYLVGKGHRRIAYVGLPHDPSRRDAYDAGVAEHGLEPLVIPIERDADRFEQGRAALPKVAAMAAAGRIAVQAFNDEVALGLIAAATEQGLRVPEDLAIVGFDNLRAAAWCTPALTTVAHPHEEIGRLAARLLLQQLGPNLDEKPLPRRPVLATRLVVRKSA